MCQTSYAYSKNCVWGVCGFVSLTDLHPSACSLGVEPVDQDIMSRPPRKATDRMITLPLLFQIVTTSLTIVAGTLWVFRKEVRVCYKTD